MTGAGRLSSGPQPVTVNAAPLFLLCIIDRDAHQACAHAHRRLKWHPESVSIATRRGTRVRVQRRDRLTAAPGNGAVIAIAEGEPLSRVLPARNSEALARGIEAARPRRYAARFICGRPPTCKDWPGQHARIACAHMSGLFSGLATTGQDGLRGQ
jgi:hypothetical protein